MADILIWGFEDEQVSEELHNALEEVGVHRKKDGTYDAAERTEFVDGSTLFTVHNELLDEETIEQFGKVCKEAGKGFKVRYPISLRWTQMTPFELEWRDGWPHSIARGLVGDRPALTDRDWGHILDEASSLEDAVRRVNDYFKGPRVEEKQ